MVEIELGREVDRALVRAKSAESRSPPATTKAALRERLSSITTPIGTLEPARFHESERMLAQQGRWHDLDRLYEVALDHNDDPEFGRSILLRRALLWLEKLRDPKAAIRHFRRVLSSDPDHIDALDGLRLAFVLEGRSFEAADVLDRAIVAASKEDQADLCIELAHLVDKELGDVDRALSALRYAFTVDPNRSDVLQLALGICQREGRFLEAKAIVDTWAQVNLQVDPEGQKSEYRTMLRRLGEATLDRPLDHIVGQACLLRAIELGDLDAEQHLLDLQKRRAEFAQHNEALRLEAMHARDKSKASAHYVHAAELELVYGNDPKKAEESIRRALLLKPGFLPAIAVLERILRTNASEKDVVLRVLAVADDVIDDATKCAIWLRAARKMMIVEAALDEKTESIALFERVLALWPNQNEARAACLMLYEESGRFSDSVTLLKRLIEGAHDADRQRDLGLELGRVLGEQLGEAHEARAAFERVLAVDPDCFEAAIALRSLSHDGQDAQTLLRCLWVLIEHSPDRTSRLSRMKEAAHAAGTLSPQHLFDVERRIFLLLGHEDESERAIESLVHEVGASAVAETLQSVADRVGGSRAALLYKKAARLFESEGRRTDAIDAYKNTLRLAPDDVETQEALLCALEQSEDPAALLEALKARLERAPSDEARVELWLRLAPLLSDVFGDLVGATELYRRVLEVDPAHEPSLFALDSLLLRLGQDEARADVLRLRIALSKSDDARTDLTRSLAELCERVAGHEEEAAQLWFECFSRRANDDSIRQALRRLVQRGVSSRVSIAAALLPGYREHNDVTAEFEMLGVLLASPELGHEHERAVYAMRAARLAQGQLHDFLGAFSFFSTALLAEPENKEALDEVIRLGRDLDRPNEVVEQLEKCLLRVDPRSGATSVIAIACASVVEGAFSDSIKALALYRRAFDADPMNAVPRAALARLMLNQGEQDAFCDVVLARARELSAPSDEVELMKFVATTLDETGLNRRMAAEILEKVSAIAPDDRSVLSHLSRLYGALGERTAVQATKRREAEVVEDMTEKTKILIDVAGSHEAQAEWHEAISTYRQVIELDMKNEAAVAGLERLMASTEGKEAAFALERVYSQNGDFKGLVRVHERLLELETDPTEKATRLIALAEVLDGQLGESTKAFHTAALALATLSEEGPLFDLLERIARKAALTDELFALYEGHVEALPEGSDARIAILTRIARMLEQQGADRRSIASVWTKILKERPGDATALDAMSQIARDTGDFAGAVAYLERLSDVLEDTKKSAEKLRQAARIMDLNAEEPERVARLYERILDRVPDDTEALNKLDALYGQMARHHDRERLLTGAMASTSDKAMRAELGLKLARLYVSKLDDAKGAVDVLKNVLWDRAELREETISAGITALESILQAKRATDLPLASRTASILLPVIQERRDVKKAIGLNEVIASAIESPHDRKAHVREIARAYERDLDEPSLAFLALAKLFQELIVDSELANELDRLSTAADAREELADLFFEAQSRLPEDSDHRAMLQKTAAIIYDLEIGRLDLAAPLYEATLNDSETDEPTLNALERIYRKTDNPQALERVLSRRFQNLGGDGPQKTNLAREVSKLRETVLGDTDGALVILKESLEPSWNDKETLSEYAALAERAKRPDALVVALIALKKLTDNRDEKAAILAKVAHALHFELAQPDAAMAALREGMDLRLGHPAVVSELSAIFRAGGTSQRAAAKLLEGVAKAAQDWPSLVACLEAQLDPSSVSSVRKEIWIKIADVHEQRMKRLDNAFTAVCRALHEDPTDDALRVRIERLAKTQGLYEDLAAFYLDELDQDLDATVSLALRRRVAEIFERELSDPERAIGELTKLLEKAPDDAATLASLERLYRSLGSFDSLAEVYRTKIARAEEPATRITLMRELARVQADFLKDEEAAMGTLVRILDADPNDIEALSRISKIHMRAGQIADAASALVRLIDLLDAQKKSALEWRLLLAELCFLHLADPKRGAELLRENLDASCRHAPTRDFLKERLTDALASDESELALALSEILATAGERANEPSLVIEALSVRADLLVEPALRAAAHKTIAALYRDKLNNPELAFSAYAKSFRANPSDEDVRAALVVAGEAAEMIEEVIALFDEVLKEPIEDTDRLAIEQTCAELLEHKLQQREKAAAVWEGVTRRHPSHPRALEALDRLNTLLHRPAALIRVLERRLELEKGDKAAAHALWMRLGALWDEALNEPVEAQACFERARAILPEDLRTNRALVRLLDPESSPELLEAVVRSLLPQTTETGERTKLTFTLASLLGKRPEHADEAVALLEDVIRLDPRHAKAGLELEQLLERLGRWDALSKMLAQQLERPRDEREALRVKRKLATVRGAHLGKVDDAVAMWNELLKKNPSDPEALFGLRQIYRAAGRWADLAQILKRLIPLQADVKGIKSIRFELAEIYLHELNERDHAIEAARRVLDIEPHDVADLLRLEEIFLKADAFVEAIRVMTARSELSPDPGDKADILLSVATLVETKLQKKAQATAIYERVFAIEPSNAKAYDALATTYTEAGDYKRLVDLKTRKRSTTEDPETRRRLAFEVIQLYDERLGLPDLAFTAACGAFTENPGNTEAQAILERLAQRTDNWEILAEILEEQIAEAPGAHAAELTRRVADIAADKLGDRPRAERLLVRAVKTAPNDEASNEALLAFWAQEGRHEERVELLLRRVETESDLEPQKTSLFRAGRILHTDLTAPDRAIEIYQRILALEPTNDDAVDALCTLFTERERWPELIQLLSIRSSRTDDAESRATIQLRIADLWEHAIGDVARAIDVYRDVLDSAFGHEQAIAALERLYQSQGRTLDLLNVYQRQISVATERAVLVDFHARTARVYEDALEEFGSAADHLDAILRLLPGDGATFFALERVLRRDRAWMRLAATLADHIAAESDPKEKAGLLAALAEIEEEHLSREAEAERHCQEALGCDPHCAKATIRLAHLFEHQGKWEPALAMLGKATTLDLDLDAKVDALCRMGRIEADVRIDAAKAKMAFGKAVELDPACETALLRLVDIASDERDFDEAYRLLLEVAAHTKDPEQKAQFFERAACVASDHRGRTDDARWCYEQALLVSPDRLSVLRPLVEIAYGEEAWPRAEELLLALIVKLDRVDDKEELCRQYYRLAYIGEKLGRDEDALARYFLSYELDPSYLPTLEGLSASLVRLRRWEEAQRIFQAILVQHREALTDAEVVDVYHQLGEIAMELGAPDRARRNFEKALELDSVHVATLRSYATLMETAEEWDDAYEYRARLVENLRGHERFLALLEQADLCQNRIRDPYRAIDALSEARKIEPDNAEVLDGLATLYGETSQHPRALEALEALMRVASTPASRHAVAMKLATAHQAAGDILKAVSAFNVALDAHPTDLTAFQEIERLLTQHQRWGTLEENYRRMLERIPKDAQQAPKKVVLWRSLGDLYRMKLADFDGAKTAYEVVLKLKPDEHAVKLSLAGLLAQRRETAALGARMYHELVPVVDDPAQPVRELFGLHEAMKERDRSLCALSALVLMRAASGVEQRAYELLIKQQSANPTRSLDDRLWRTFVLHPACRGSIADILSVLYRGAPQLFQGAQAALELKKKERVELDGRGRSGRSELLYFNVYKQVSGWMQLAEIDHYHRATSAQPPRLFPGQPAVLFAGEQHEVFREMPSRHIAWLLARQLACARPELAIARALMPEDVASVVEGAIRLFAKSGTGLDLGLSNASIQTWNQLFERSLSERALTALRQPVQRCLEQNELKSLGKFLEGVEHSASRAAALFCGDARIMERALKDSDAIVEMSERRRTREHMLFLVSSDYATLREQLGLAIVAPKTPAQPHPARG